MKFFGKPEVNIEAEQIKMAREQHALASGDAIDEQAFIMQQKEREDLLRWQQNVSDELIELKFMLRGYYFDEVAGKWVDSKEPLMNEKGVKMVDLMCRPLLSRNLINSNLDEKRILNLLKRTADTITLNIAYYGITDYKMDFGNFPLVSRLIKNIIIPTPFRALNGWNKNQDNMMSKRVEAFQNNGGNQQKKSLFGLFN